MTTPAVDVDEFTTPDSGSAKSTKGAATFDDVTWILTSTLIIFTMQTGFGLLESGSVTRKNSVNILMKNCVDVILGGFGYWVFGYGLQYGSKYGTNPIFAVGDFCFDATDPQTKGFTFASFIFQLSFATTATTIVSGAMAERTSFNAYCLYSLLNTFTYCVAGGWIWGDHGFLRQLGFVDFAGGTAVHVLGGTAAFIAAYMLKPRLRRKKLAQLDGSRASYGPSPPPGSPGNIISGAFILWWGWVGFNCGSSFGVSHDKWHYAGRAAIATLNGSIAGCLVGFAYTMIKMKKVEVDVLINAILAGLVSVTAGCGFYQPWEALVVGAIGGLAAVITMPLWIKFNVDDPVGAVSVHGIGGLTGTIAVGILVSSDSLLRKSPYSGLLKGGGFYLLGIQTLGAVCVIIWSATSTYGTLWLVNKMVPIRMTVAEEVLGADFLEHNILHPGYDFEKMKTALEAAGHRIHQKWFHAGHHPEELEENLQRPVENRPRTPERRPATGTTRTAWENQGSPAHQRRIGGTPAEQQVISVIEDFTIRQLPTNQPSKAAKKCAIL